MFTAKGLAVLAAAAFSSIASAGMDSPDYPTSAMFNRPMAIPPVATPRATFTNPESGKPIQFYQIDEKPFDSQQYPNLGPTHQVGYNGAMPGPTFHIDSGTESVVRFVNHNTRATVVHLHGSESRSPFDGYADDVTPVGWYKDYYYPNIQSARTLWYHDHVVDHTAENVYFGLAGFYILHDAEEEAFNLPSGKYDVPLGIMARRYNSDGTLWDPDANNEVTSVFGDVVEANGVPWPYFEVEPRTYRFRFLDLGVSRTYILFMQADQQNNQAVPFTIVGADTGILARPVVTDTLTMSIAERWEAIIDFTQFAGQNITLRNQKGVGADKDFDHTQEVLRFVVGTTVTDTTNNGPIPSTLRDVPFPPQNQAVADRHFLFHHSGQWMINDVGWDDGLPARLLAAPQRGSIEIWQLQNGGGGWSHPIHIHLIDFQVIARTGGKRAVLPYEAAAMQDVVWLGPGETATVIARYQPWPGRYMFHCHNLIHEDHDMLAEFNVTQVEGLGLNETELFIDPLEAQYRAVGPFNEADFQAGTGNFSMEAIHEKVNFFASKRAYQDAAHVDEVLEAFWAAKTAKEARDSKFEHYGMSAKERRDRLQGWYAPEMTSSNPKLKARYPKSEPLPGPQGWSHLAML